ncbi:hypothetical protein ACFX1X_006051 [Malus domestica]
MASSFAPSFLHLHLLFLICSVSLSPTSAAYSESRSSSNKVRVELYYETLCPDSYQFIVNDLIKLFETGIISVADLKLYPYGNARVGSNSTITCQVPLSIRSYLAPLSRKLQFDIACKSNLLLLQ